jgi:LysM repeat protein
VILWIKRSHRFFPLIEARLAQAGMPADLKYLPVIESALRPHVGSPKGALGFWQFKRATGLKYGLTITAYIDERRNLEASTQAAISYLKDLNQRFGSWTLAAAAYNMGEEGLEAEARAQKQTNYYKLYLPLETQRFVFRILAAKMLLSNPGAFGFEIPAEERYTPYAAESIEFKCMHHVPLQILAEAARTTFKEIKDLNPEIRGHYLEAGAYRLRLPLGSIAEFNQRYAKLVEAWRQASKDYIYVVQAGDNLSSIAERFKVPLPALLIWNRLSPSKPIHPGDRLVIHDDNIFGEAR